MTKPTRPAREMQTPTERQNQTRKRLRRWTHTLTRWTEGGKRSPLRSRAWSRCWRRWLIPGVDTTRVSMCWLCGWMRESRSWPDLPKKNRYVVQVQLVHTVFTVKKLCNGGVGYLVLLCLCLIILVIQKFYDQWVRVIIIFGFVCDVLTILILPIAQ